MFFEFQNISYSYGTIKALNGLTFSCERGQIVALIGENGAGKSTAIKNIVRFLSPDKGKICLEGQDILNVPLERYPVSYIPDIPVFYEELSLLEHLQLTKTLYPAVRTSIEEVVSRFELQEHCKKVPSALSKGTRQKLMVAMSCLREFKLLVADEPFSGLDPQQIAVLKEVFLQMKREGKMVLLSSHLLGVIENICDKYVIIRKGSLLFDGTKEELLLRTGLPMRSGMEDIYLQLVSRNE